MIQFDTVYKRYDTGQEALKGVSFDIPAGEMLFLTGHSGAGKSTLLKLIMMMERPTSGQVVVGGENLKHMSRRRIPGLRRKIGVVFQNHQLLFDRTVYDNVALPLIIAGYQPRDAGRRVRAALDKVGLLSKERANPITLSGGEQQRVGIARAVVNKPDLLLADEPTGNLDSARSIELLELLQKLNVERNLTIVMVTHEPDVAAFAKRRVVFKDGHIVEDTGATR